MMCKCNECVFKNVWRCCEGCSFADRFIERNREVSGIHWGRLLFVCFCVLTMIGACAGIVLSVGAIYGHLNQCRVEVSK